jgi:multidrug resistance efflux pump
MSDVAEHPAQRGKQRKSAAADGKSHSGGEASDKGGEDKGEGSPVAGALQLLQRHKILTAIGVLVVVVAIGAGVVWWLNARQFESTDDAVVDAAIVHIGAPAVGIVDEVDVEPNQQVAANALLAKVGNVELRSPVGGYVAHLTAAKGSTVLAGQELMIVVPDSFWITAQFKETQLADMRKGQPATITIDAYPGLTFPGKVDSFEAGAGQAFSPLPPDNATGNYVKTVQRVAMKIVFDTAPQVNPTLGPGMSANVEVKVR